MAAHFAPPSAMDRSKMSTTGPGAGVGAGVADGQERLRRHELLEPKPKLMPEEEEAKPIRHGEPGVVPGSRFLSVPVVQTTYVPDAALASTAR